MMKKAVFLAIIFCSAVTAHGQDGLGEFKIGMSIEQFFELPIVKNKKFSEKTSADYSLKEFNLWMTTSDTEVLSNFQKVFSKEVVKFELNAEIGIKKRTTGRDSYKTTIYFYKDKLAIVNVDDVEWEIESILKEKYGNPVVINDAKVVICQNGYGARTQHLRGTITSKWGKSNKNIAEHKRMYFNCGDETETYTVFDSVNAKIINKSQEVGLKTALDADKKVKIGESKL